MKKRTSHIDTQNIAGKDILSINMIASTR